MPKFDQERHSRLVRSAAFACEFFRGTWQDLSAARRAMTAVGNPGWGRTNGLPCLKQAAVGDGATSDNVAAIVDVTGAFAVEWCGTPMIADVAAVDVLLSQRGATGGFEFSWDCVNGVYVLTLYDAAGAIARSIATPAASAVVQYPVHVVIRSTAGGTAGATWIRGIPAAPVLGGAGIAANVGAASPVVAGGAGAGLASSLIARGFASTVASEDVTALAEAARELVGGW